jgi:hypothetical protein
MDIKKKKRRVLYLLKLCRFFKKKNYADIILRIGVFDEKISFRISLHTLHFSRQMELESSHSENKVSNMSLIYALPSVKNERIGKEMQRNMLTLWSDWLDSTTLVGELEAVTCQWQARKLTIFGTRMLSY